MTHRDRFPRWAFPALFLASLLPAACTTDSQFSPLPIEGQNVVAGVIRETGGQPAADVVVSLEPTIEGLPASVREQLSIAAAGPAVAPAGRILTTSTDNQGRFAFEQVTPGDYLLSGTSRNHQGASQTLRVPPRLNAALTETTFVDIALVPTGTFTGVAALEQKADDSGTVVWVLGTSNVAVTSASGAYVLSGVPTGSHTLQATHEGWLDASANGSLAAAGDSVAVPTMTLLRRRNMIPVVSLSAPATGNGSSPTPVTVTAYDPDGIVTRVEVDWEDDGVFDSATNTSQDTVVLGLSHLFTTSGTYRVKARAYDDSEEIGLGVSGWISITSAFFVSVSGSNANPGTEVAPFRTLTYAITYSASNGNLPINMGSGTYVETVTLPANMQITGGYNTATWTRTAGSRSILQAIGGTYHLASVITNATFTGLEFRGAAAPTNNSIGLVVNNNTSTVTYSDCAFLSGTAGAGTAGFPGGGPAAAGASGQLGQNGSDGSSSGGSGGSGGPTVLAGGFGGSGGYNGNGNSGSPGTNSPGTGGSPGAGDGACGTGLNGGPGFTGTTGSAGANGGAATAGGIVSGLNFNPNDGQNGTSGGPGGGGGGGGGGGSSYGFICNDDRAGGGGGGGGGGTGGNSAQGGFGGSCSFGVLSIQNIASAPIFQLCVFTSGNAGNGGAGGNGGTPGSGGSGAPGGNPGAGSGGSGGTGGNGGPGGPGGGGSGGPGGASASICLLGITEPTVVSSIFNVGLPGSGGPGGLLGGTGPAASTGPSGVATATWDLVP